MEIKLQHNIKELTKNIEDQYQRQIPFAVHYAMNKTAIKVKKEIDTKIKTIFHKPTSATQKSTYYIIQPQRFNKTPLANINAMIYIVDEFGKGTAPAKYLEAQIIGGIRSDKRSEVLLKQKGILKQGEQLVPSKYYMDSNGNIKNGVTRIVLSDLQAHTEVGHTMNRKDKSLGGRSSRFVFIRKRQGRLAHGIYERRGNNLIPVFFIVGLNNYKMKYPFQKIGDESFNKNWDTEFKNGLTYAISTAR